ncbi:hypothetical protein KJ840_00085 [Patescibacteria group bacterium]|nr:hypothetical protein [Patescibacteria group bacterium]
MQGKIQIVGGFIIVFLLGLVLGGAAGFYFQDSSQKSAGNQKSEVIAESAAENSAQSVLPQEIIAKQQPAVTTATTTENILANDYFALQYPLEWEQSQAPEGISAIIVNNQEEITNPEAQKINFRTYFSVIYDSLQGRGLEDFVNNYKAEITRAFPDASFVSEVVNQVNNQPAYFLEVQLDDHDLSLKVFFALIQGQEDDMWILTFNTQESNWSLYQEIFSQIVNSFELKG